MQSGARRHKSRHQLATMGRRRRFWAGLGWQDRPQAPAEPLSHSSWDLHFPITRSQGMRLAYDCLANFLDMVYTLLPLLYTALLATI